MPRSELTQVLGLEVLEFFKNKDFSVKVFQMLHKYYVYSQKYVLNEQFVRDEKVS